MPEKSKDVQRERDEATFLATARAATAASGHRVELSGLHRFSELIVAARFILPNGLRIVLMPDRRAPVFAYQTWFRVGSGDEDPERTGLAHLFEHLMFKGTRAHAPGVFDREMEKRGSETNAATWVDWTYYTQALAARGDHFETVVAFEADRMTGLVLDEETFQSELEVVKNERRMLVDDSISGALNERLFALAFSRHSYRWPTIGAMAHLNAASPEELRAFYRAYYAPNNASIVLVGDLEPTLALRTLARSYGSIESQPIHRPERPAEPQQEEPRRDVIERPMVAPQMVLGFHIPAQNDRDFPAVEMLSDALVAGDSSRLYRRLVVEEALATEVEGYALPFADPGLYELSLTLRPHAEPEQVLALVQKELSRLGDGLSPREVNKAKASLELALYECLRDAELCASTLGHYESTSGDFALAFEAPARLGSIGAADLQRVAREVFRVGNCSTVMAFPESRP